jgi:putative transposase
MSWKETSVVEERFRLIQEYQSEEWCMVEVCRRFGISRFTGYKWLDRYQSGGVQALEDRARAPHGHPNQVLDEVEEAIVGARGPHPHGGAVKWCAWLKRNEPEIQ